MRELIEKYQRLEESKKRYLKTKAKCTYSNGKSTHRVYLEPGDNGKQVLVIEDTPGRWYVVTLLGLDGYGVRVGDRLAIDYGQDWYVENMGAILGEVTKDML